MSNVGSNISVGKSLPITPSVLGDLEVVSQREIQVINPMESRLAKVAVAEAWANLIGWKIFGLMSLGLMLGELSFGLPPVFPPWVLLALGGAGLGGRELANVILSIFSGVGHAADAARGNPRNQRGVRR